MNNAPKTFVKGTPEYEAARKAALAKHDASPKAYKQTSGGDVEAVNLDDASSVKMNEEEREAMRERNQMSE